MRLSVIVPVYNERDSIEKIIDVIKSVPVEKEIIVIDDFSKDGTRDTLKTIKDIKLLFHEKNQGKGSAIRTGIKQASGDIIIIQDADLEYNPNDYTKMLPYFNDKKVQAVFGSRFKGNSTFLLKSRIANKFLVILTNILYSSHISDMETCYKMVRRNILNDLNLTAKRFEIEPEITSKLLKKKIRIVEIPINYKARTEGKKIGVKDALTAVTELFKWRFKSIPKN
jgi:glycosyltransferase involved in cell wall biosynthesis